MQPAIYTKLLDSGEYISLSFYLTLKKCEGLTFKSLAIMYTDLAFDKLVEDIINNKSEIWTSSEVQCKLFIEWL